MTEWVSELERICNYTNTNICMYINICFIYFGVCPYLNLFQLKLKNNCNEAEEEAHDNEK